MRSKTIWIKPSKVPKKLQETVYAGMTDLEATLLYNRKIDTKKKIKFFHSDDLSDIPSWQKLYNANKASKQILRAVKSGKKIFIHGDYDADGICASALLWEFLYRELPSLVKSRQSIKPDITPYIPDRGEEGYGLSEKSVQNLISQGAELIITVDCGIRDGALIKKYQKKGVEFIVTDHHQPPSDLPEKPNYTIVHQLYPGKEYPYREISGAFVVFLLIQAMRANLNKIFDLPKPISDKLTADTKGLDLVAFSTITDIMPLTYANRIAVKHGLRQLSDTDRVGMSGLIKISGLEHRELTSYDIGFVLGPRINATGRIGEAIDALKLLVTENEQFASEIAEKLDELNSQRQEMTEKYMGEMTDKVETQLQKNEKKPMAIFEIGDNIPEGIIGLVAGKLQEKYNRPVIIASRKLSPDGTVKEVRGSARSISGFNITKAIEKFSSKLEKYGGHDQAAGFSCKVGKEDEFREQFLQHAEKKINEDMLIKKIKISAIINTHDIDSETIEIVRSLEPYGYGNPKPVFMMENLVVVEIKEYETKARDSKFLKLKVKGDGIDLFDLLIFRYDVEKDDPKFLQENMVVDAIGTPDINEWKGYITPQFLIKDWAIKK